MSDMENKRGPRRSLLFFLQVSYFLPAAFARLMGKWRMAFSWLLGRGLAAG